MGEWVSTNEANSSHANVYHASHFKYFLPPLLHEKMVFFFLKTWCELGISDFLNVLSMF